MASYTYPTEYNGNRTVEIPNGWKQFHRCNAMYRVDYDNIIPRATLIEFVSYETKLIRIIVRDFDEVVTVYLNPMAFKYSRTTTKQFLRFIGELPKIADDSTLAYKLSRGIVCSAYYEITNYGSFGMLSDCVDWHVL